MRVWTCNAPDPTQDARWTLVPLPTASESSARDGRRSSALRTFRFSATSKSVHSARRLASPPRGLQYDQRPMITAAQPLIPYRDPGLCHESEGDDTVMVTSISRDLARATLAVLFIAGMIVASFWVLRPFLPAVVWATMIVVATWPLMLGVQSALWGRRGLAVSGRTACVAWLDACKERGVSTPPGSPRRPFEAWRSASSSRRWSRHAWPGSVWASAVCRSPRP